MKIAADPPLSRPPQRRDCGVEASDRRPPSSARPGGQRAVRRARRAARRPPARSRDERAADPSAQRSSHDAFLARNTGALRVHQRRMSVRIAVVASDGTTGRAGVAAARVAPRALSAVLRRARRAP